MNSTQTPDSGLQTPDSRLQTPDVPYDALLLVSFGGPEGMDDVLPFLRNVLKDRSVPHERMLAVAKHYELFEGVSPINAQNSSLIAAIERELETNGPHLPIYFGNRNWHPLLGETLGKMRDDGVRNALAFVTSAYSSYSGCRQYLEDIERARELVGPGAPRVQKLRAFYNHPGFIEANVARIEVALAQIPGTARAQTPLAFTAHSIPESMAANCDYEAQLQETSRLIADAVGSTKWRLVFQSRSGSPSQPWLGPDVCDYLRELQTDRISHVVVSPIGFVSDHMEVVYDLDTQATQLSRELGIKMVRAGTVGTHPAFVKMIRELILERVEPTTPRRFLGTDGTRADSCRPGCCPPG